MFLKDIPKKKLIEAVEAMVGAKYRCNTYLVLNEYDNKQEDSVLAIVAHSLHYEEAAMEALVLTSNGAVLPYVKDQLITVDMVDAWRRFLRMNEVVPECL